MLFNDWSFKKKVKKFKPVPDRRMLEEGESRSATRSRASSTCRRGTRRL